MPAEKSNKPKRVLVIGAGITGLTVAHELVERGYEVTVVEKALWKKTDQPPLALLVQSDGEFYPYPTEPTCNVGGMARTQWGLALQEQTAAKDGAWPYIQRNLEPLDPEVLPIEFQFAGDTVEPKAPAQAKISLDKLKAYLVDHLDLTVGAFAADSRQGKQMLAWVKENLGSIDGKRVRSNRVGGAVTSPTKVFFAIPAVLVPGEHGFRFFPAFYRHLFDTMKRTPIPKSTRGLTEFGETVYDNLVSTETLRIGLPGGRSFDVNRTPRSVKELRKIFKDVMGKLGWTARDIGRLELKMFKYMTSSKERRNTEYENISWSEFIDQPLYSEKCQRDLEWSPQTLGALRGSASDCRTQGNISIQLMLEQVSDGPRFDSLLNGPTSIAWLQHWRAILEEWGVTFVLGELTGFNVSPDEKNVLPRIKKVEVKGEDDSEVSSDDIDDLDKLQRSDAFVLALDLPSIRELTTDFLKVAEKLTPRQPPTDLEDFNKVKEFLVPDFKDKLNVASPDLPLQHLSGVQFFFGVDKAVRLADGHALYMEAPWGLTSITQSLFWQQEIPSASVLSVDVATWDRKFPEDVGAIAWGRTRQDLAKGIWDQINANSGAKDDVSGSPLPMPSAYHIDDHLKFKDGKDGELYENKAPFLVNRTGEFPRRPGQLGHGDQDRDLGYRFSLNGWVLAGTYMKTYTRITTMEAANESGRHAANGVLAYFASIDEPFIGERCQIWDPEDNEVDDLEILKKLDGKLHARKKPHFIDILGWETLPDEWLPSSIEGLLDARNTKGK